MKVLVLLFALSFSAFGHDDYSSTAKQREIDPFETPNLKMESSPDGAKIYGKFQEGCMIGAVELTPEPGSPDQWEDMVPSRQRFFGHPDFFAFMKYLAASNRSAGHPELGDASLRYGGPLIGGHASHEVGLDGDLRYELSKKTLTEKEREHRGDVVVGYHRMVGYPNHPKVEWGMKQWNDKLTQLLRSASENPKVARIFVTPALKKYLCDYYDPAKNKSKDASKKWAHLGRAPNPLRHSSDGYPPWLMKLRPWWGHDDHFHVRLSCPSSSPRCVDQKPVTPNDPTGVGCSGDELTYWFDQDRNKVKTVKKVMNDDGTIKKDEWGDDAEKVDDPSFLAHETYSKVHKKEQDAKPPEWSEQIRKLPPECQALKEKLKQQLKSSAPAALPSEAHS